MFEIDWEIVLRRTIEGGLIGLGLYYVNRWQQRRKKKVANQGDIVSSSSATTERSASATSSTRGPVAAGSNGEEPQYCSQCGQIVVATAKFCGSCGAAIQFQVPQKHSVPPSLTPVPVTPTPSPVEDERPATPPAVPSPSAQSDSIVPDLPQQVAPLNKEQADDDVPRTGNTGRMTLRWKLAAASLLVFCAMYVGGNYVYEQQAAVSYLESARAAATAEEALPLYRLAAERGSADAQYELFEMYASGDGVPQDEDFSRLRYAAEQGHADAQTRLAEFFATGDRPEVSKNDEDAAYWFRQAAEQGDARGQYGLGMMYLRGQIRSETAGDPLIMVFQALASCSYENNRNAHHWLLKSANQGHPGAQTALGNMLEANCGVGVSQDIEKAMEWYQLAADQGESGAMFRLGHMYNNGGVVPFDPTQAVNWWQKAADEGWTDARFDLGEAYRTGSGVDRPDPMEASRQYQLAAQQGHVEALQQLGELYFLNNELQDFVQAYKWINIYISRTTESSAIWSRVRRDDAGERLTPDQRAEAQQLAREWDEAHPQ